MCGSLPLARINPVSAQATEPRRGEIEANGIRVATLEWGDSDAPLALLIHGYPDTAWTWRHLGPFLAEAGWHAVAPFTRGYGPSGFPEDGRYLVEDMARDVLGLEEALRGTGPSVLVGHDWGALVAWAISSAHPDRFARLVAMAVPPPATLLEPWRSPATVPLGLRQLGSSWYFFFNQIPGAERSLSRLIPRLWRTWSPGYDPHEDLQHLFASLDSPARLSAALGYYRDNLRPAGFRYLRALRPAQPTLYLHGSDDGCVRVALTSQAEPLLPDGSRLEVIDGVGHFMQLEDPDRVNPMISRWLGESSQMPPTRESL